MSAHPVLALDPRSCYQAMLARDTRFDGRFFVGVASTRVYCRPVCTVRTPRRENCSFYPSAPAAEAAGYRPCLRCRPELAPGFASVDATSRLARRAACVLEDDPVQAADLARLARRLGVTDRHLRRVFVEQYGVSPKQFVQTRRMLLAKALLTDTTLPVTEVAYASGFASIRRFNTVFRDRYRLSPSALRRAAVDSSASDGFVFRIGYRPPFAWTELLEFLERRTIRGVEQVVGNAYRRAVMLGERVTPGETTGSVASGLAAGPASGWIEVRNEPRRHALAVRMSGSLARVVPPVLGRVRRLFDTDLQPAEVGAVLGDLAAGLPGLRLPGAFDGFEMAVRAILGQQVSVRAAHTLAGRLVAAFGDPVETPWPDVTHVFPDARRIAAVPDGSIAALGIVGARARSIVALARAVAEGLRLEPDAELVPTLSRLRELPGIGEWTAQYIAMRALGWPDAFPSGDLGVRRALGDVSAREATALAERWHPWRGYAVIHLWRSLSAVPPVAAADGRAPNERSGPRRSRDKPLPGAAT